MADLIRYPAVAGSFYPSDKKELEEILEKFLRKAKKLALGQKPRVLIVPHAGIIYSGQTAAFGFKQLEDWHYSRVILLGASHHSFFDYAAVSPSSFWETPLGKVEVDIDFSKRLVDSKKIVFDEKPHLPEHDLEIELIFLQKVLRNFKIVPILISKPKETVIEDLAKKLEENFDNQTILIVSTDLSHYPSSEIARKVDRETIEAIISGKKAVFEKKVKEMESRGYPGVETAICGFEAVKIGLRFAEFFGIEKLVEVDYSHSGQTSGDNTSVVGYVSILGLKKGLISSIEVLSEKEKEEALDLARKTVEFFLENKSLPEIKILGKNLKRKGFGVFVTFKKTGQLRGCMGNFEGKEPLFLLIQKTAVKSAVRDPRFFPVEKNELKDLSIEISILSPIKKIDDWKKIRLGRDGVVVRLGFAGGTYLPQVEEETDWTLEEFLTSLCQDKAGLKTDCFQDKNTEIFIFQTQVF